MTHVPISADLGTIFATATQPVVVEDEDGMLLGCFIPTAQREDPEPDIPTAILGRLPETPDHE